MRIQEKITKLKVSGLLNKFSSSVPKVMMGNSVENMHADLRVERVKKVLLVTPFTRASCGGMICLSIYFYPCGRNRHGAVAIQMKRH